MAETLTKKGRQTRQRIIQGAAAEIRENGLSETTLDDIRTRTQTSKGQLFHYFPEGKDQLLLEVAHHEAQRVLDDQQPHLGQLATWQAWRAWRDAVIRRYQQQGRTCPLSVLMTELGRSTPAAQAVTTALINQWELYLVDGIRAMQRTGRISAGIDAERAGKALLSGVQGGVSIMLATGSLAHLEAAIDTSIAGLRQA